MGLLERIKEDAQKSGQNRGKFIFIKDGQKKRIRFLQDLPDGFEITFHDSFEAGINVPCQEVFGRGCQYCDEEGLRTRSQYAWTVWDCEDKEVKIFMYPMNNCSPIGQIAAMYETYGTLLDRDYVISVTGKQQSKQFSVIPMDKQAFKNKNAKPLSKNKFLEILDKAYPDEHSEYAPSNSKRDDEEENENDYSSMSAKELYNLCKERDIDVQPKKPEKYYIKLLEEYDTSHEDWEDDSDDEDEEDW